MKKGVRVSGELQGGRFTINKSRQGRDPRLQNTGGVPSQQQPTGVISVRGLHTSPVFHWLPHPPPTIKEVCDYDSYLHNSSPPPLITGGWHGRRVSTPGFDMPVTPASHSICSTMVEQIEYTWKWRFDKPCSLAMVNWPIFSSKRHFFRSRAEHSWTIYSDVFKYWMYLSHVQSAPNSRTLQTPLMLLEIQKSQHKDALGGRVKINSK